MSIIGPREDSGMRSAITVTPELEKAVAACSTPSEIAGVMRDFAVRQGVAVQNADGELVPTGVNPPQKFGGYITVDGVKTYVEGSSPEELQEKMREAMAPRASTEQAREERGRFTDREQTHQPTDAERAAAQADLELKFKRGQITTDEYLAQSGAIERHLEAQGISVSALQEASASAYQNEWATATQKFLSDPSNDWPGGDQNRDTLAKIIAANPELLDADDKVAALTAAHNFAKENNLLVANPETELSQKLAHATSPEEIDALLGRHQRNHYDRGY